MTKEMQRILLASVLIFLVVFLQPIYMKWFGIDLNNNEIHNNIVEDNSDQQLNTISPYKEELEIKSSEAITLSASKVEPIKINIENELYYTTISNHSGGTFLESTMIEKNGDDYKYLSTQDNAPVTLQPLLNNNHCNPCLGYYDKDLDSYTYINQPFRLITEINTSVPIYLDDSDTLHLEFQYIGNNGFIINKSIIFYGNSYETVHNYTIINNSMFNNNLELIWSDGLAPVEKGKIDVTGGNAMIGQSEETEKIIISAKDDAKNREEYIGNTDWASVRTKYFIAALLSKNTSDYAAMSGQSINYLERDITPLYNIGIGYDKHTDIINSSIYLGPLDIDHISKLNSDLDKTINFGWWFLRPIGKIVLWFLKFLHNTFYLNYGICLIIFAAIIQFITSPLTKKTYKSSQKMQEVQPLVKKIQEKYKNDSQKMNQEVMKIYREKGVNPLGGCLPLLLQMPLLIAIFSVFRDTIEFRGAHFILWIKDLSQPDILFYLPEGWWIPIYGNHVALLPILMGISIFLTQRLSMATMDPAQKPMMYGMNAVFILIFNSFPSGLNLYYTVYNLLNYFQQKSIRAKQ